MKRESIDTPPPDSEAPLSHSALAVLGPLEREKQFLADLALLVSDRALEESRISARFEAGKNAADRTFQETRGALETRLASELHESAAEQLQRRDAAERRYQAESTNIERLYSEAQDEAAKQFEAAQESATRKHNEARWEAETVYDGHKQTAPKQLEEIKRQLAAWLERSRTDLAHANQLLAGWRQPAPQAIPPHEDTSEVSPSDDTTPEGAASATVASEELARRLQERTDFVSSQLQQLAKLHLPAMAVSHLLAWFYGVLILIVAGVAWRAQAPSIMVGTIVVVGIVLGIVGRIVLHRLAREGIAEVYPALKEGAADVEALVSEALALAQARTTIRQRKLLERRDAALSAADQKYQARLAKSVKKRDEQLAHPNVHFPQRLVELTAEREHELEAADASRHAREETARQDYTQQWATCEQHYSLQIEQIHLREATQRQELATHWLAAMQEMGRRAQEIGTGQSDGEENAWLLDWQSGDSATTDAATAAPAALRFGKFVVDLKRLAQGLPRDPALAAQTPTSFGLPALVPFPDGPSLLFKAQGDGRRVAIEAMQAFMLRLLTALPPGKVRFTIFDPVGLGENFAAFMHLADYNEALVTSRIWTDPRHIEQRLADLSEHMENVIQKYLRNEFASIEDYNRDAGEIAEPFRFLVVANFPTNFTEAAQRRLLSIATTGARCGVYTLILVDNQVPAPPGFSMNDLEQHSTTLVWQKGQFVWKDESFGQFPLVLDRPPAPAGVTELLQTAGQRAVAAGRVEVPFGVITPPAGQLWSSSAQAGIDVPLGRAGATRLQSLKLGKGTSQHVLIAGKTGSGKSTLLHALITNLALRYSPSEVELYLIDFKQGVEFKTYATHRLPHVRVVAIESDREFGVSVLARLDAELKRRADLFRQRGVQDLAGYRQAAPGSPMPRILLIVDEFQEFFVEDDKNSQDAALLLDRLVRQGRAFGVHVLLGSQTLAGTYTLARSTIGQMAVRIALQCSEADAHLILSEDNSAARLLARAGEAIYNDSNGLIEGNHPFQVVWLSDAERDRRLAEVQALHQVNQLPSPPLVVFEGNVPADIEENRAVEALLAGEPHIGATTGQGDPAPRIWLGEAVAIKEPTSLYFRSQSGSNLLLVGQNEDAALGILGGAVLTLAAQQPQPAPVEPVYFVLDGSVADSAAAAAISSLGELLGPRLRLARRREIPGALAELTAEIQRRQQDHETNFPPLFLFCYAIQNLRDLRKAEDDFSFSREERQTANPAKQLTQILREGPALGIHTLAWCDSLNNLNRTWDRQALREFEQRVVFQMSVNDSSTLIDSPLASKLGPHRALFHSEELGILEKFRPYRWPSSEWLAKFRRRFQEPESGNGQNPPASLEPTHGSLLPGENG